MHLLPYRVKVWNGAGYGNYEGTGRPGPSSIDPPALGGSSTLGENPIGRGAIADGQVRGSGESAARPAILVLLFARPLLLPTGTNRGTTVDLLRSPEVEAREQPPTSSIPSAPSPDPSPPLGQPRWRAGVSPAKQNRRS